MPSAPKQTRRDFLKTTGSLAGLSLAQQAFPSILTWRRRSDKPNLVFIWTDQQRPNTFAAFGNSRIHAPNLNRLAAESTIFERSYVTQPVCTPSRSSVLTGLWPSQNGCIRNNIPLSPDALTHPELLDDTDYRTAYMGKWHLGNEIWAQRGFEEWKAIEELYIRFYGQGRDRNERSDYHHFLVENGFETDLVREEVHKVFSRQFAARLPLQFSKPVFLRNQARDFIRRHRDEPFLLHVNFLEPHDPNFGPFDGYHPDDEVNLPENWKDYPDESEPIRYQYLRKYAEIDRGITEKDVRRETSRYWGLVTMVDMAVGGILRELEKWGLEENTIIVYTSDHGEQMVAHGLYYKSVMYEESARVLTLIKLPKKGFGRRRIEHHVSHIDLTPTMLDLLGVPEKADGLPGRSLRRYLEGSAKPESVFLQWHAVRSGRMHKLADQGLMDRELADSAADVNARTIVTPEGLKLSLRDRDVSQLYDLSKDPHEMENLYSMSRYRKTIAKLTKEMEKWQKSIGDSLEVRGS